MKIKNIAMISMIFFVSFASAANIGVSPANIEFKNVLRGGYAERPITITIDTEDLTDVSISTWGDISDWIKVSEEKFSVSRDSPKRIIVSLNPPEDVPNGVYTGFVRINSSTKSSSGQGPVSSNILPILDLVIRAEITDIEIIQCRAGNFEIYSAEEKDDIIFIAKVLNEGNVRFYPKILFEIWDSELLSLVKVFEYSSTLVLPTKEEQFTIKIPSKDLKIGQYWVDVLAVDCFNERTLTFDILEEGALRADGILQRISVEPWANINDIVPITIYFKNTGEKPLNTRFSGKVLYNNKIVQLLESNADLLVPLDSEEEFQFFFTPREAGRYVISGRVLYDSKRTYEHSAILNVRPGGGLMTTLIKFALYTILLIIIAILIYKIRKERRSYVNRLRQIRNRT